MSTECKECLQEYNEKIYRAMNAIRVKSLPLLIEAVSDRDIPCIKERITGNSSNYEWTLLQLACYDLWPEGIKYLVNKDPIDVNYRGKVNSKGKQNMPPLHYILSMYGDCISCLDIIEKYSIKYPNRIQFDMDSCEPLSYLTVLDKTIFFTSPKISMQCIKMGSKNCSFDRIMKYAIYPQGYWVETKKKQYNDVKIRVNIITLIAINNRKRVYDRLPIDIWKTLLKYL